MCVCMCIYMCVHIRICMCIYMYVCTHILIYIYNWESSRVWQNILSKLLIVTLSWWWNWGDFSFLFFAYLYLNSFSVIKRHINYLTSKAIGNSLGAEFPSHLDSLLPCTGPTLAVFAPDFQPMVFFVRFICSWFFHTGQSFPLLVMALDHNPDYPTRLKAA